MVTIVDPGGSTVRPAVEKPSTSDAATSQKSTHERLETSAQSSHQSRGTVLHAPKDTASQSTLGAQQERRDTCQRSSSTVSHRSKGTCQRSPSTTSHRSQETCQRSSSTVSHHSKETCQHSSSTVSHRSKDTAAHSIQGTQQGLKETRQRSSSSTVPMELEDTTPTIANINVVDSDSVNQVMNDYCRNHRIWGSQAKNCRPPCKANISPPKTQIKAKKKLRPSAGSNKSPVSCTSPGEQSGNIPQICSVAPPQYLHDLLTEFSDISGSSFSSKPPQHGITHTIETTGKPCHSKPRRLDEKRLKIAKEEFAKMEKAGIIERANSPWSSPLHMVPKSDGSWRPCGDYRVLNTKTVPDHYPLPHIGDFTQRLHGCKIFTKLDLVKAYYQIPMSEEDMKKTCIITPFGSFIFKVMPFGLLNSGATFQRVIDMILGDLPYCFCYMDDILIASRSEAEHLEHLRHVFQMLRDNGLVVNFAKCEFSVPETTFLGHTVSEEGIRPLKKHIDALESFPLPTDRASVQRFLGLFNFFRRFVP